jgi:maltose O-acetyltransferase
VNQKERMLAQLPYKAWLDGLSEERMAARKLTHRYNQLDPEDEQEKGRLIREILGGHGEYVNIEPPFRCDYGKHIQVGENFFANFNLVILDVARVTIGNNVMFGPNVSIYTAGHPVHPDSRNSGYEYGREIVIGDNVWIGGNVVVNPGVTIGSGTVIGSGSVVTKDIPDMVIAAGNPCRVIRKITEEDRKYFYRDQLFDVTDYLPE